ncbi:amidohydrolase family protein [Dinoroseobacter sp. PD6]|uniref:metal-dependent hydrolase family protein n=1 Tax=Dinoroseobacter sp. PD6 TaxID=3028384 RepID=UPI00237A8190|nr:amidohydrolase family protein [Dinoroseobacter sp. PD6]MDD9716461.1 amidohydrolase family protein [Dinoroseobacter sp. PD6]
MTTTRPNTVSRRALLGGAGALGLTAALPLRAQEAASPAATLIKGAAIFDGRAPDLITGVDVLVEDGMIAAVGAGLSAQEATVIDATGLTLTPGLTDAHTHIMWHDEIEELIYGSPHEYTGVMAAEGARRMLMRGFTTVRDAGGPAFGLKRAIDAGVIAGPRILPSGFFISQTSGHGDFEPRMNYLSPHFTGQLDPAYLRGWTITADGKAEVMKATREALRYGATQIKIMGSGSITGAHDPLDVTEFTLEELQAIVAEAQKWGTYAKIHAYSDASVQNALTAGVRSVEHGLFASEESMQMMKDKDVFFSTQYLTYAANPEDTGLTGDALPKFLQAKAGATEGYERAKAFGLKVAWGTDILGTIDKGPFQSLEFVARTAYYTPTEILMQATSGNAELFARSGARHPYQAGPLGVIEPGAYGDLLLVNGNPLDDISILTTPETSLALIMKGGVIHKNIL